MKQTNGQEREDAVLPRAVNGEEPYRVLTELTADFAFGGRILPDGTEQLEWVTEAFPRLLGYTSSDFTAAGWELLLPENDHRFLVEQIAALRAGKKFSGEHRAFARDGSVRYLHTVVRPLGKDSQGALRFVGACQDISDRKRSEQERQQHLREIESLNLRLRRAMQETHHRVKNNLQVINSLLEMQIIEGRDTVHAEDVRRIMQHVGTLAMIHDLLTQEARGYGDLSHISIRTTLEKLIGSIAHTLRGRPLQLDIEDIVLPVQQVTSLAILVNESITNAIRHGEGAVTLALRQEGDVVRLTVGDCGKGFPANFDPSKMSGTGLELMESAARWDLRGEIFFSNAESGGACVQVTFPLQRLVGKPN